MDLKMYSRGSSVTYTDARSVSFRPPDVTDFERYLPWAAKSLCLEMDVIVTAGNHKDLKNQQQEEADQKKEAVKYDSVTKKKLLSKSVVVKKASAKLLPSTANPMKTVTDVDKAVSRLEDYRADDTLRIEVLYDEEDCMTQVLFRKVPKDAKAASASILKLIGLLAPYVKQLESLVFKNGLSALMLHEMQTLLVKSYITEVILDFCFVPEANFHVLLAVKSNLRYLSLAGCLIGDKSLESLMEQLSYPNSSWRTLAVLNLASNMITDDGASHIAHALRSNMGLVSLDLSSNQITDKGAVVILGVLTEFPLTFDEIVEMKMEKMEYLKKNMTFAMDRRRFGTTRRDLSVDRKKHRSVQHVKETSKSARTNKVSNKNTVNVEVAVFEHPFSKDIGFTFVKDQYVYHNGNFTLKLLNFNYNSLTNWSVRKLLDVLMYQQGMKSGTEPIGLMRVFVEGNPLIAPCDELHAIYLLFKNKSGLSSRYQSHRSRRINLM